MSKFFAGLALGLSFLAAPAFAAMPAFTAVQSLRVEPAVKTVDVGFRLRSIRLAQQAGVRVSRSMALRMAMAASPGSRGLGVRYVPRLHGYVVKLKTGNRIHRVFVDAYSGAVRR